jgi:UDP-N-acetylglucosamine--dolichyl-phosphate N-acetylglucosaminephosphotransferase
MVMIGIREVVGIFSLIFSVFATAIATPRLINYFKGIGIVDTDEHKKKKPFVATSAGICVVFGLIGGLFFYIAMKVFVLQSSIQVIELLAAVSSIMIITFVGFLDDLNTRQVSYQGSSIKVGIRRWMKPLLTLPAAIPLMAVKAGTTTMVLPLIGSVDLGLLYPLLIIPIGLVCAANMVNMLGGYNALEASMGLVYTASLGFYAFYIGQTPAAAILLTCAASLFALIYFVRVPAKILAGDSLTYALGAVVACGAIIGNIERAALITMFPFIVQGLLKFYSRYREGAFASDLGVLKDGRIERRYKKIYSLTHLVTGKGATEKQIVRRLVLIQVFFATIPWLLLVI